MKTQHKILALSMVVALVLGVGLTLGTNQPTGDGTFELERSGDNYTFRSSGAKLADILPRLSELAGLDLKIDPRLNHRVTADLDSVPVEKVLAALATSRALVYEKADEKQYRLVQAHLTSEEKSPQASPVRSGPEKLGEGVLTNAKRPIGELRHRSSRAILLQNAVIDTDAASAGYPLEVPEAFAAHPDSEYQIVQFEQLVTDVDRQRLEALGARVAHYVPNSAFAVHVTPDLLDDLRAMPGVVHVEPFHPYFKMSRDVLAYLMGIDDGAAKARVEAGRFSVMSFRGASVADAIAAAGGEIVATQSLDGREVVTVLAEPAELPAILAQAPVQWMEPDPGFQSMNDLGNRRIRANGLRALHPTLTGEGVVVGVTDSGIDFRHPAFALNPSLPTTTNLNSRIVSYHMRPGGPTSDGLPGDNDGHGTHVSGSILGNGALSDTVALAPGSGAPPYRTNQFAGVAPAARIVAIEDFNSFSAAEQGQLTLNAGARISNNSWGNSVFEYGASSALWDALVRDADTNAFGNQELIAFFAAGNSGSGGDDGQGGVAGTVGQPGNAKNVITVGALELPRYANNLPGATDETDSDWQVASFSSRGPVTSTDVRFKPDIVAPGSYVLSVQSSETLPDELIDPLFPNRDYRYENLNSGTNYAFFSGTSMATPLVAGGGALMFQYYTNRFGVAPSPALMKAMMVAGARMVNSLEYKMPFDSALATIVDQGFGSLDVRRSVAGTEIRPTDEIIYLDQSQTTPVGTGEVYQRQISLGANEGGLKVVLAWTDPAGTPGNSFQLVNDIDLIVRAPGGGGYLGNQFALDGVNSRKFDIADPNFGDEYNNVESVVIGDAAVGTYTIEVRGWQVPQAPQSYALVIMKGIGIEGRTRGASVDMALNSNSFPAIAYSALDEGGTAQIFVKQWIGPYGDESDRDLWRRLDDQWFGYRHSAVLTGISRTLEESEDPSIAMHSTNIFVAWRERPRTIGGTNVSRVFMRQFTGSDWVQLNNSAQGFGVAQNTSLDAFSPKIGVMADGRPVLSWLQYRTPSQIHVRVAKWDGTNWIGLAGSHTNGLTMSSSNSNNVASALSLAINGSGNPVVAWKESAINNSISVRRWNGASWDSLNYSNALFFIDNPKISSAPHNDELFLTWRQQVTGLSAFAIQQIFAARRVGSSWTEMAGSFTFPGISAAPNGDLSVYPYEPDIAVRALDGKTNVIVSWRAGNDFNNFIFARVWTPGATNWISLFGAGEQPGVDIWPEKAGAPVLEVDRSGLPLISFPAGATDSNDSYIATYTPIGDRQTPTFEGLQTAVGGTNGQVVLSWLPATDNISSTIIYRIYRGTQTFACGASVACDAGNVFSNLVGTVTNSTTFTVTGLTANLIYCFGVRAADTNGLLDPNTVTRSAGPVSGAGDNDADCLPNALELAAGTEPCIVDTDGDGMWDGWEWTFSTNNPSKTNAISISNTNTVFLSPIDNGIDNVRTPALNDGLPHNHPNADPDGDGASNLEEFQWWQTLGGASCAITNIAAPAGPNPTAFDTDGDGMPDGWEMFNGLNPTINDAAGDIDGDGLSNLNEYLLGGDPNSADTDGDGLLDGDEFSPHETSIAKADTDGDGLDDGFEVLIGSNPRDADSNNSFLTDNAVFQLGMNPTGTAQNFSIQLSETFETGSTTRASWTSYFVNAALPFNFWHLSTVEPDTNAAANPPSIITFDQRTTNTSYRAARDLTGTNLLATYSGFGSLAMALQSPAITNSASLNNLFVSWMEWFETEPNADFAILQARSAANTNWVNVSSTASGRSGSTNLNNSAPSRWIRRAANLTSFAGQSNVQFRFLFTANAINNQYKGWFVDDVTAYAGVIIEGWVRDENGRAIEGATVRALGRGGVTNAVDGNAYVLPGLEFGQQLTAANGSYRFIGLPAGNYYLKAEAPSHIAEFYDGPLFTGAYAFAAGFRPGVYHRDEVTPAGVVGITTPGSTTNIHFELGRGSGPAYLGIAAAGSPVVTVNQELNQRWNGQTNGLAAFTPYTAAANLAALTNNKPDWITNPVQPLLLNDLSPGLHRPYIGTNFNRMPLPEVMLREGEETRVEFRTNAAAGRLSIVAEDGGSYGIRLNGFAITNTTPALIPVLAGRHEVQLVSPTNTLRLAPKTVFAPKAARVTVTFTTNDLQGVPGGVRVNVLDINGNNLSNIALRINGEEIDFDDVLLGLTNTAPTTIVGLRPGTHRLTASGVGYTMSDSRPININAGITNQLTFVMRQADRDYDLVGDAVEILGYTNVFNFHRNDDPDVDGLSNLFEFNVFRDNNVLMNPFDPDSDADGLSDGDELAYNGVAGSLALARLATNTVAFASTVDTLFAGRYLAGINYFGTGSVAVSVSGDRFVGTVTHPLLAVPSPSPAITRFINIPMFPSNQAVNIGHNINTEVFGDGHPGRADTDADGMWDGFEFDHGLSTIAKLDLIEAGRTEEDPDADGLTNVREFLGVNNIADLLDSSNPTLADSDGDFIPDGWEYSYGFDPNDPMDAFIDFDGDGLVNLGEYLAGTNPKLSDTDADFLPDFEEVVIYMTDPLNPDTDADGLLDGQEVWDFDMDGIFDGGFFPMWAGGDLDGDGLVDGPTDWDTDGDGMPDGFEVLDRSGNVRPEGARLNPYDPTDADEDADGDGLTNLQEFLIRDALFGNTPDQFGGPTALWDFSTDPFNSDTDGDGMPDGYEVLFGLHPVDPIPSLNGDSTLIRYAALHTSGDPDFDGLWNLREYNIRFRFDPTSSSLDPYAFSTHPWNPDTDADGLGDGEEDRAFRTHPIQQDTDADRLTDGAGVPGKHGEVETGLRSNQYLLVVANLTWEQARAAAQVTHDSVFGSGNPTIGQLAVFEDDVEYFNIISTLGISGADTNVAIGGFNTSLTNEFAWQWVTGEGFQLTDFFFEGGSMASTYTAGVTNHLAVNELLELKALPDGAEVTGYIVRWTDVPSITNHYDKAFNDLWRLVWPANPANNLPFWERVVLDANSPVPPARWGAAMTYIPVFERKNARDNRSGPILMDNRQLVLFGGRDGVHRWKDVWEYVVRSNAWIQSTAPMNGLPPGYLDGLSEVQAVPLFTYKNTRGCPCDDSVDYDCDDSTLGLPKNRPWSADSEGGISRSYDLSFLFGGWDQVNSYDIGHWFYKSTDDPRPVTDSAAATAGVTEFAFSNGLAAAAQDQGEGENGFETLIVGHPLQELILNNGASVFASGYSAIQFEDFAFKGDCDEILKAEIRLRITRTASITVTGRITAEFTFDLGNSDVSYSTTQDTGEPSVRLGNPVYYNSSTNEFVIPAGYLTATVDVTSIVRELVAQDRWRGNRIGFVFETVDQTNDYVVVRRNASTVVVTYKPAYKVEPSWDTGPISTISSTQPMSSRKSAGLVYDWDQELLVLFGGIDGNKVLGDLQIGSVNLGNLEVNWTQRTTANGPSARWGHSMAYDEKNQRVVLFGGFDSEHRPLRDLWFYSVANNTWTEFKSYRDDQIPSPRGGASLTYFGGFDYERGLESYCDSPGKDKLVLFGGTDGENYFNDTWVFDDGQGRWILAVPNGRNELISPPPRAFAMSAWAQNGGGSPDLDGANEHSVNPGACASGAIYLFGGRAGALPTGRDTDADYVEDGTEHELGGPLAGRDPRVNAMVVDNGVETIPYSFKSLGPINAIIGRGYIADFESLRHDAPDVPQAALLNIPYEGHVDQWSLVQYTPYSATGVDAIAAEFSDLWYTRHGIGDPFDARNEWKLGRPDNTLLGSNAAPPYAFSGRWVYGTDLKGNYADNAVMELYAPLVNLTVPSTDSTYPDFAGSYFLMFHEWLDLADSNDVVRIDAVRPETPSDLNNRVTGLNRPVKPVLPNRNNLHNTSGRWRRVIVPLDILANDTNVFLRFTLQSDAQNIRPAGGWYLDDVAIFQAAQLNGVLMGLGTNTEVCLIGEVFNDFIQQCTQADANGNFNFGLLPLGNYQVVAAGTTNGPYVLSGPEVDANITFMAAPEFTSIMANSPVVITWTATNGAAYQIDYTTNLLDGIWTPLYSVTSVVNSTLSYTDAVSTMHRIYRVSITNAPGP